MLYINVHIHDKQHRALTQRHKLRMRATTIGPIAEL